MSILQQVLTATFIAVAEVISYATWNPSDKAASVNLSNGNLTAASNTGFGGIRATIGKSSGKWYWEMTNGFVNCMFGIANSSATLVPLYNQANSALYYGAGGSYVNWSGTTYDHYYDNNEPALPPGGIIMFALDMDNGAMYIGKAGTWYFSGVPTSGASKTGAWVVGLSGTVFPAFNPANGAGTINFGASSFTYSVPAGYHAGVY